MIAEWKSKGYIAPESVPTHNPLGWLVHDDIDSVVSAAYKFAAARPATGSVITGASTIARLDANISTLELLRLPKEDSARLKRLFGHIAEYA